MPFKKQLVWDGEGYSMKWVDDRYGLEMNSPWERVDTEPDSETGRASPWAAAMADPAFRQGLIEARLANPQDIGRNVPQGALQWAANQFGTDWNTEDGPVDVQRKWLSSLTPDQIRADPDAMAAKRQEFSQLGSLQRGMATMGLTGEAAFDAFIDPYKYFPQFSGWGGTAEAGGENFGNGAWTVPVGIALGGIGAETGLFGDFLSSFKDVFSALPENILPQGTGLSDLASFEQAAANVGNGFWDAASVAQNAAPAATEGITFGNAPGITPEGFDVQHLSASPQGLDAQWPNMGGEQGFQTQNVDLANNMPNLNNVSGADAGYQATGMNLPDMTGANGPWSQFADKAFPTDFTSSIGSAMTAAGATAGAAGVPEWLTNLVKSPGGMNALGGIANLLFNNTPDQLKQNAQTGAAMADPFSSQRPFYQGQLAQIYSDPNYLSHTPWYQGLRDTTLNDVSRSMAARGYNMSSNETKGMATELQNRAFNYLQPWTQMTGQFAGAGGNPGQAGQIYAQGANAGTLANQNQMGDWASIIKGFPDLAKIFG